MKQASREAKITADLREQITRGFLAPGSRLPLRPELEERFDAATQTVQRAMTRLMKEGFLVARGRLGTFVADRPPHLHHYGVVFASDPTDPHTWERYRFSTALYREALALRAEGNRNLSTFLSVNQHADSEDRQRLLDHAKAHRLAGLIFDNPNYLSLPPLAGLAEQPNLPCVVLADKPPLVNTYAIHLAQENLIRRALDFLQTRGRRRVALLAGSCDESLFQTFRESLAQRGLATSPYLLQAVSAHEVRAARNCMHMMMNLRERPDALLITDDSLVEYATEGLLDAGIRTPNDLDVVAHGNFPYLTSSHLPIRRIGFGVPRVLATALDLIDRRRRGETVPAVTLIPPIFDDEPDAISRRMASPVPQLSAGVNI